MDVISIIDFIINPYKNKCVIISKAFSKLGIKLVDILECICWLCF